MLQGGTVPPIPQMINTENQEIDFKQLQISDQ